jgi:hypothetical protein
VGEGKVQEQIKRIMDGENYHFRRKPGAVKVFRLDEYLGIYLLIFNRDNLEL